MIIPSDEECLVFSETNEKNPPPAEVFRFQATSAVHWVTAVFPLRISLIFSLHFRTQFIGDNRIHDHSDFANQWWT